MTDQTHRHALLTQPFVKEQWRHACVNIDYHVKLDQHYYSVLFNLIRKEVELWITRGAIEQGAD